MCVYSNFRISFLWQISKSDIQATLKSVCKKVLHDHSVDSSRLEGRRIALQLLGSEYRSLSVDAEVGLDDLLHRVGVQSGIFGSETEHPATSPTTPPTQGRTLDRLDVFHRLKAVGTLSVRELRRCLEECGAFSQHNNCPPPIEKQDMQKALRRCLLQELSVDDLKLVASANALSIDRQPFTNTSKNDLVDILSGHDIIRCPG